MQVRTYGTTGPQVIVLHGGPGAPGHMAPVARGLANQFRVFEPFQRDSGNEPLTVARHVEDLHEVIHSHCGALNPALIGSSWGAMLGLAFAVEYPNHAGPLVLIGCGTFDPAARQRYHSILKERMDAETKQRLDRLAENFPNANEQFRARARLLLPLYSHDLITTDLEDAGYDARAHAETWADMVRLQDEGVYPAAFTAIHAPVLMLHGSVDPHPGQMIRASLEPFLPQLEYHEWDRCGHFPWLEKAVCKEFFEVLHKWLLRRLGEE